MGIIWQEALRAPSERRSVQRKGNDVPLKKWRDLARSLVASEAVANPTSLRTEPASVRVYERLRRQLGAPMGADGFQSLASRALALARSESPRLKGVHVMADGGLHGLGEVEAQTNRDEDGEVGVILIAQLLGVFLSLLGEATTLRLIEDLRLQAHVSTDSAKAAPGSARSAAEESAITATFEDLLLEIDRLRNVSERIEDLANKHPGMEEGLMSTAGNIRSIATVLDVFTLIKSKAGGSQEDAPIPQTNGYMN